MASVQPDLLLGLGHHPGPLVEAVAGRGRTALAPGTDHPQFHQFVGAEDGMGREALDDGLDLRRVAVEAGPQFGVGLHKRPADPVAAAAGTVAGEAEGGIGHGELALDLAGPETFVRPRDTCARGVPGLSIRGLYTMVPTVPKLLHPEGNLSETVDPCEILSEYHTRRSVADNPGTCRRGGGSATGVIQCVGTTVYNPLQLPIVETTICFKFFRSR